MVDTIPTNLFEWSISTTLHIHIDSDACPHGFDSSTGAYLDVIFNELTIDVDYYLLQFVANILGDSNCASLAGIESNMCDYMTTLTWLIMILLQVDSHLILQVICGLD